MKRISLTMATAILSVVAFSCSDNSEQIDRYTISANKFDSVYIQQDTIGANDILNITTYSTYRTWCDKFYAFDFRYSTSNLERKIAVQIINDNQAQCGATKSFSNDFTFKPQHPGTYKLKFWKGDDNWIDKTIVVQ